MDPSGTALFDKRIIQPQSHEFYFTSVATDSTGNFYAAGYDFSGGATPGHVYLWGFDHTGTQLWQKSFPYASSQVAGPLAIAGDANGGVRFSAQVGTQLLVNSYDPNGNSRFAKTYLANWITGAKYDRGGNLWITANIAQTGAGNACWTEYSASSGTPIYANRTYNSDPQVSYGAAVFPNDDGSFLLGLTKSSSGTNTSQVSYVDPSHHVGWTSWPSLGEINSLVAKSSSEVYVGYTTSSWGTNYIQRLSSGQQLWTRAGGSLGVYPGANGIYTVQVSSVNNRFVYVLLGLAPDQKQLSSTALPMTNQYELGQDFHCFGPDDFGFFMQSSANTGYGTSTYLFDNIEVIRFTGPSS